MCDQQRLRSACAYAQSDQSLCSSLEYSMSFKLLTENILEALSLKGGCTGSSESKFVKNVKLLEISCHGSNIICLYTVLTVSKSLEGAAGKNINPEPSILFDFINLAQM